MNLESTKQLDDPESTSTGTSTGNREKQTRKLREWEVADIAAPNINGGSQEVVRQLAPQDISKLQSFFLVVWVHH